MTTTTVHPETLLEHHDFVRGLAKSLLFDDHQVDDVVQQTWLAAMRSRLQDPGAARAFLGRIVRSRASNLRRDEARLKARERRVAARDIARVPSAAEVVEREAVRSQVVQAVLELDEPYRGTVLLRYFENRSPAEIAADLGIPAATVRTRLKRGLEKLRGRLDQSHGGNRQAWCLHLVPLAAGGRLAPAATAASLGWKFALVLAVFTALLSTGWWTWFRDPDGGAQPPVDPVGTKVAVAAGQPAPAAPQVAEVRRSLPEATASAPEVRAADLAGFRGRLLLPDGKPAAGRAVSVMVYDPHRLVVDGMQPMAAGPLRGLTVGRVAGRTDARGVFELTGLWPRGHYLLRTDVQDGTRLHRVLARSPGSGELVNLGDLTLEGTGSIAGTVVDDEGEPVAGALVWCTDVGAVPVHALSVHQLDPHGAMIMTEDGDSSVHLFEDWMRELGDHLCIPAVRTDADGQFELAGVFPGMQTVVVHGAGLEPFSRPRVRVRAGAVRKLGRIRLPVGQAVIGSIQDAAGQPIAGAQVLVAPRGVISRTSLFGSLPQLAFARRIHTTDAAGHFRVAGLPRTGVSIAARATAADPWVVFHPADASAEHRLQIPAPTTLRVQVRRQGDAPPKFRLLQGHQRGEMALAGLVAPLDLRERVQAGADDTFTIGGLLPGRYTLLVQAAGHRLQLAHVDTEGLHRIDLAPAPPVGIRVLDSAGQPLAGAAVFCRPEPAPEWSQSLLPTYSQVPHWEVLPAFTGHTDRAGRVSVTGLAAGKAVLTVTHPRYGGRSMDLQLPLAEAVVIRFEPAATLTGQLMDGDRPASPDRWVIGVVRADGLDGRGPDWMRHVVRPDPGGNFTVRGLAPGNYRLEVLPAPDEVKTPGSLQKYLQRDQFGIFSSRIDRRVELRSGPNKPVVLNADPGAIAAAERGAHIRGTVMINGRPGRDCYVRPQKVGMFLSGSARRVSVDARGRFDLGRLSEGEYRVYGHAADGKVLWSQRVKVVDADDHELDIAFDTGGLSGVVTDPDGRAIRDCQVQVNGPVGTVDRTVTDAEGRFAFDGLPVGTYRLAARDEDTGECSIEQQPVEAARNTTARVRLLPFQKVSGRVDLDSFRFKPGTLPQVHLSGSALGQRTADVAADGRFAFAKIGRGSYQLQIAGRVMTGYGEVYTIELPEAWQADRHLVRQGATGMGRLEVADRDVTGLVLKKRGGG